MTVALKAGNYNAVVDPAQGGAILSAEWRSPAGANVAILEPMTETLSRLKAGCFAMVPFANRIADGRFSFEGRDYALPVNHPAEAMAIHGFGRDNPWRVTAQDVATLILEQDFERADNPYRYHARQEIGLSEEGLNISLFVRNDGSRAMPFGIGLHPWFPKSPRTTLTFASRGVMGRDARGLPSMPSRAEPAFDADTPAPLGAFPWFDGFMDGWEPHRARLARPEDDIAIEITADGAFRHLHVFVPDDRAVLCAEPVSHAPDAINRPQLGGANAMHRLAPGDRLAGTMTIRAMPYPPVRGREDDPQNL
ncbi:aldose 1-epimerase [Kaistia terrae]|uniref:Aldose 1-epimerase n=1 Tax=Kaistia terrae TaxID=537017 RepID=A0ABW0Q1H3_9HYPH|nr:aldose 1-epimerase [Kaistia terrae]MCX5579720.1 aldose 1-epimerase [Kaistia terrae]